MILKLVFSLTCPCWAIAYATNANSTIAKIDFWKLKGKNKFYKLVLLEWDFSKLFGTKTSNFWTKTGTHQNFHFALMLEFNKTLYEWINCLMVCTCFQALLYQIGLPMQWGDRLDKFNQSTFYFCSIRRKH